MKLLQIATKIRDEVNSRRGMNKKKHRKDSKRVRAFLFKSTFLDETTHSLT